MTPASSAPPPSGSWQTLSPLPDPIGYAGMAAGVLGGRLVAAGGSQWDRPVWRQGTRAYTDRVFVLDHPGAEWRVAEVRLPAPAGHFAAAASADALLIAGGNTAAGAVATVHALRAQGAGLVLERLPDLPAPVGYAAAAVAAGRFFVVGGVPDPASTAASRAVWSLDLARPAGWSREADLPGPGLIVPAAAGSGSSLLVLGGATFGPDRKAVPSRAVWRLPSAGAAWEARPDLPEPRVGGVSPCPVLPGGEVWLIGGYAEVWGGAPREHPGFSARTFLIDPASGAVRRGPELPAGGAPDRDAAGDPGPRPMIAAPAVTWAGRVVVVGGEVRIATRTPAVLGWASAAP